MKPNSTLAVVLVAGVVGAGHAAPYAHDDKSHTAKAIPAMGHAEALGKPGHPGKVSRTISVDMTDAMRFTPARIEVKQGETIRFVVKNLGKMKHEMVLGTLKELQAHGALMRKSPRTEHRAPNAVDPDPGKTGELVWHFTQAGNFDFACLEPGHLEAGMKGTIAVKSNR